MRESGWREMGAPACMCGLMVVAGEGGIFGCRCRLPGGIWLYGGRVCGRAVTVVLVAEFLCRAR